MLRRLAPLLALPLAVAACGGGGETATTAPPTSTTAATTAAATTTAEPTSVVVYFLRDGKVAPVRVETAPTRAVATAALTALLEGPPAGYDTAVPSGGRLVSLAIADGVATATLSDQLRSLDAAAAAQIVYTLTRFPSVDGVRVLPQPLNDEDGRPLRRPATRPDFEGETPAILIESPLPGDEAASPVQVRGTANTFEATFQLALRQAGRQLAQETVTATSGTGERGTFDVLIRFEGNGRAALVGWEDNAGYPEGGAKILHRVEVPVTLR